jgi:hypothetical protein
VKKTKKLDERLKKWWDKENSVHGYYIDDESNVVAGVHGVRRDGNRNIFAYSYLYFFITHIISP